jgi:hypothetical protein
MKPFIRKNQTNGTANPLKQDAASLNYTDLQELLETLCQGNWLQNRLQEKISPEARTIESVGQFSEMFPPDKFNTVISHIREVLMEMGFKDNVALDGLAEYLFADIFIGRPEIDPAYL